MASAIILFRSLYCVRNGCIVDASGHRGIEAEQKSRTYARILYSAMSSIRMRGIGGASITDVLKGAGLTVGGFYAHFGSKDALIEAALRSTAQHSALSERCSRSSRRSLKPIARSCTKLSHALSSLPRAERDPCCSPAR